MQRSLGPSNSSAEVLNEPSSDLISNSQKRKITPPIIIDRIFINTDKDFEAKITIDSPDVTPESERDQLPQLRERLINKINSRNSILKGRLNKRIKDGVLFITLKPGVADVSAVNFATEMQSLKTVKQKSIQNKNKKSLSSKVRASALTVTTNRNTTAPTNSSDTTTNTTLTAPLHLNLDLSLFSPSNDLVTEDVWQDVNFRFDGLKAYINLKKGGGPKQLKKVKQLAKLKINGRNDSCLKGKLGWSWENEHKQDCLIVTCEDNSISAAVFKHQIESLKERRRFASRVYSGIFQVNNNNEHSIQDSGFTTTTTTSSTAVINTSLPPDVLASTSAILTWEEVNEFLLSEREVQAFTAISEENNDEVFQKDDPALQSSIFKI